MSIQDIKNSLVRSIGAGSVREGDSGGTEKDGLQQIARVERSDRVEISSEGRALAARPEPVKASGEALTPEHVAAIEQRLATRVYLRAELAEEVAARLLNSGDF